MTLVSGQAPYQYTGSYPFRVTDEINWPLGYSGINFEEVMWVALAERRRYAQPPGEGSFTEPFFQNYQHSSGLPGLGTYNPIDDPRINYRFEPTTDGSILGGSGQIHATDWIFDLRAVLSGVGTRAGVFTFAATDSDSTNIDSYTHIWLRAKVGETPGTRGQIGVSRYWNHEFDDRFQEIPDLPLLGSHADLYDIDFDEVQYKPFPRFRRALGLEITDTAHNVNIGPGSPIFPAFAKTDGSLLTLTTVDKAIAFDNDFRYAHVGSGYIRIDGDALLEDGMYEIGSNAFGTAVAHEVRPLGGHILAQTPTTRMYITPPAHTRGIYRSRVYNTNLFPPSGEFISEYRNDMTDTAFAAGSGFEYFTDALWFPADQPTIAGSGFSGIYLQSPLSNQRLWCRFAESPLNISDAHVSNSSSSLLPGTITGCKRPQGVTFNFQTYSETLGITSTVAVDNWLGSTGSTADRLWTDTIYLYQTTDRSIGGQQSPLLARFTLSDISDQSLADSFLFSQAETQINNPGSDFNAVPSFNPARMPGFYNSTSILNYAGVSASGVGFDITNAPHASGIAQLFFNPDPINHIGTYSFGAFKPLTGFNFNFQLPIRIQALEVINTSTDFDSGIWAWVLVNNNTQNMLVRIEEQLTTWDIVDLYGHAKHNLYQGTTEFSVQGHAEYFFRLPL